MRPRVDGVVRNFTLVVGMLFVGAGVWAQEAAKAGGDGVEMEWGVKIPMRDGVKLNATVYHPHGKKETLPVIFTLTSYIGSA